VPLRSIETWADGLADAVHGKLARAVGVSNYNVEQMRRTHAALAKRMVPLRQTRWSTACSSANPSAVAWYRRPELA